jgi:hypothetical protein
MTNRWFFTDLENLDRSEYSEILFNTSEFLTHILLNITFSCTAHLFCVPIKHVYFTTLTIILVAHELWHFEKNVALNIVIK